MLSPSVAAEMSHPRFSFRKLFRRLCFAPVLKIRAGRLGPRILEAASDCSSILDFGCGDMILTEYLKKKEPHKKVVGIDTLDTNLSHLPLYIYDGTRIPFDDNAFDAIFVGFVLHHCQNINGILEEIKRVAAKRVIILEEVYESKISRKVLHCHDFGNRLLSWKMEIPLNFKTLDDWVETFRRLELSLENTCRIYQYPCFNLTHQILFDLSL
jgi:SAM-dependent methyltransferase